MQKNQLHTIEPGQFYSADQLVDGRTISERRGDQWVEKIRQLRQQAREWIQQQDQDPHGIPPGWPIFSRQKHAFEYQDRQIDTVHVFAFEPISSDLIGRRKYVVVSCREFWKHYCHMKPHQRCFYEVIRQGTPCHLYLDLEYSRILNPGKNDEVLMQMFKRFLIERIKSILGMDISSEQILELSSDTPEKFSRHLIIHLPNTVFSNNLQVGIFVQRIINELVYQWHTCGCRKMVRTDANSHVNAPPISHHCLCALLVHTNVMDLVIPFIDDGVYTRNRNFRIFLSSKRSKGIPLIHACTNMYPAISEEQFFYNSLVSANITYNQGLRIISGLGDDIPQKVLANSQQCMVSSSLSLTPYANGVDRMSSSLGTNIPISLRTSPYPEIDKYVLTAFTTIVHLHSEIVQGNQPSPVVRACTYFPQSKLIVYQIGHCRFCERIRREHSSNNIMLVVDLHQGFFYQKCLDPDCRRVAFRGTEHVLPIELNPFKAEPDTLPIDEPTLKFEPSTFSNEEALLGGLTDKEILASIAKDPAAWDLQ